MDGVLLAGYTGSAEELATALRGTPAVVTTRELEADGVDAVLTDDFRSAGLAVEHLHGPGHRKIAHLDISDWLPYTARREGYLHAMVQFLGSGGRLPTAIFAHNDLTAIGVMEALQAHGLDVPDDMAVVGCDNIEVAASPLIGLTSVDQHARRLGRMAARVMLDRLGGAGGAAVTRKLAPELLLVRRSSGPPAGG